MSFTQSAFISLLLAGPLASAQDSSYTRRLSLSTEILLNIAREYNFSAEYRFKRSMAAGLMAGLIRPWIALDNPGLSPSQDDFPGKVYTGISVRPFLKYYRAKNDRTFWDL